MLCYVMLCAILSSFFDKFDTSSISYSCKVKVMMVQHAPKLNSPHKF